MSSPPTTLKRYGSVEYEAMLVAMAHPPNWSVKTMLLRFAEENGCQTVFVVTGAALESFGSCDLWRIYAVTVPGKCVRQRQGPSKYGV